MSRREKIIITIATLIYFAFMGSIWIIEQGGLVGIVLMVLLGLFGFGGALFLAWANSAIWSDPYDD